MIKSAARRTLVGTRFRRMGPLDDVAELDNSFIMLLDRLEGSSDQGDGKGLRGEIIDADAERVGTPEPPNPRPPIASDGGGSLRRSMDDGRKNSDARRCRGVPPAMAIGAASSFLGLDDRVLSLPLPLSLPGPSQFAAQPRPRILPSRSFDDEGDTMDMGRGAMMGSLAGSNSGLPNANGLDPPALVSESAPLPLEPLVLPCRDRFGEVSLHVLDASLCGGEDLSDTDGGPESMDALPDRLTRFINNAPGVRAWRPWDGLEGRDSDLRDEEGLVDSLGELADRALEAEDPALRGGIPGSSGCMSCSSSETCGDDWVEDAVDDESECEGTVIA